METTDFQTTVDYVERHFVLENIDWSKQEIIFFVEDCENTYQVILSLGTSLKILVRSSFVIPAKPLNFLDDAISLANFGIQSEFKLDKENCELSFCLETNFKNNLSDVFIGNAIESAIDILRKGYPILLAITEKGSPVNAYHQLDNLLEEYELVEDSLKYSNQ